MAWILYTSVVIMTVLCLRTELTEGVAQTAQLAPLPEAPEYKASGVEYSDGGMGPMFDFARSFINTALPGGFPADFINGEIVYL